MYTPSHIWQLARPTAALSMIPLLGNCHYARFSNAMQRCAFAKHDKMPTVVCRPESGYFPEDPDSTNRVFTPEESAASTAQLTLC